MYASYSIRYTNENVLSLFQNILLKLLEVIFEKFKGVARAHEVVLKALQRVTAEVNLCREKNINEKEYLQEDIV